MSIDLRFLCALLAVWRLSHLLAEEDGPADLVVRLRMALGDSLVGRAMDCFYCLSIWIAGALAPFVTTDLLVYPIVWLALSGGACLLERATSRESVRSRTPSSTYRAEHGGEPDELLWTTTAGVSRGGATAGSGPAAARGAPHDRGGASR